MSNTNLKDTVKEYLEDVELKETLHNAKLDFGFRFIFPKGNDPQGRPIGKPFTVVKAKDKGYVEILSTISLDKRNVHMWEQMREDKKEPFLRHLSKTISLEGLLHAFDKQNIRFTIVDTIYISKGEIFSKDKFYKSIKKVHGLFIVILIELRDFFSGEFDTSDLELIS